MKMKPPKGGTQNLKEWISQSKIIFRRISRKSFAVRHGRFGRFLCLWFCSGLARFCLRRLLKPIIYPLCPRRFINFSATSAIRCPNVRFIFWSINSVFVRGVSAFILACWSDFWFILCFGELTRSSLCRDFGCFWRWFRLVLTGRLEFSEFGKTRIFRGLWRVWFWVRRARFILFPRWSKFLGFWHQKPN